ncbi:MoaD/ThiS family protein [Nocardioides sp.]|uniref:MoaD/ThiS family protein n=1 Tax=Nocardioides sp. TaxID=35761 RepID=UPI002B276C01|nr:MoaD/ThiS family protein [Nocardioides sp.]
MSSTAAPSGTVVRVVLPAPLRAMVGLDKEVQVVVDGAVTQRSVLDALEGAHPALLGTIRDRTTKRRRAFIRFFACEEDLSHDDPDTDLPLAVVQGREPLIVLGAMAGG